MTLPKAIALALFGAAAFTACAPEKPVAKPATPAATAEPSVLAAELREIHLAANESLLNGQTNAALKLLGDTLASARYADYEDRVHAVFSEYNEKQNAEYMRRAELAETDPEHPDLAEPPDFDKFQPPDLSYSDTDTRRQMLETLVRLALETGTPNDALARVIPIFNADERFAHEAAGQIYRNIQHSLAPAELLAWTVSFGKTPKLPAAAVHQAREWEFNAALDAGQDDHAIGILPDLLAKRNNDAGAVGQFAQRAANLFMDPARPRLESAAKLIATLERIKPSNAALDNLLLSARARLAAASNDWNAYAGHMNTAFADLQDNLLVSLISQTLPAAQRARQSALIHSLAQTLVTTQSTNKTSSVRRVISYWEEDARANNPADFPNRVQTMMDSRVSDHDVFDAISTFFYNTADNPDLAIYKKIHAQGEILHNRNPSGITACCLLDLAFCLGDYDGVLRLLEAGIPDKEETWHTGAIIKVKAHKAIHENKIPEAVKQFRAYMEFVENEATEDILTDPMIGLALPKEAVLGRNAARIAGLLEQINDADGAAKARAEARAFYAAALEAAKHAEVRDLIQSEIKDVK